MVSTNEFLQVSPAVTAIFTTSALIAGLFVILLILKNPSYTNLEPPPLRHWVPYLGHALSFVKDQRGFFDWASNKCNGEPFTMFVAGEKLYIFSRPDDVSLVMRQSKTLGITITDQKDFRQKIVGFSEADAEKIATLRAQDIGILTKHFINTKRLDILASKFLEAQQKVLVRYEQNLKNGAQNEDGFDLVGELLLSGTLSTFFGDTSFNDYSKEGWTLFGDYRTFLSEGFWARMVGLPAYFSRRAVTARERIKCRLGQAINTIEETESISELVHDSVRVLHSDGGLSIDGIVSHEFDTILLGANLNSIPMAYITLLRIISSPSLLLTITSELASSSFSTLTSEECAALLPQGLPHLQALFREVMRYHTTAWSAREVLSDTMLTVDNPVTRQSANPPGYFTVSESLSSPAKQDIRTYELKKGGIIALPSSLLHHNPAIHENPGVFDPQRFLSKELGGKGTPATAKRLRPFGGGGSYCPGRLFAEKQVLGFVALLLRRFEITQTLGCVKGGKEEIPRNADFFYVTKQKGWRITIMKKKHGMEEAELCCRDE